MEAQTEDVQMDGGWVQGDRWMVAGCRGQAGKQVPQCLSVWRARRAASGIAG